MQGLSSEVRSMQCCGNSGRWTALSGLFEFVRVRWRDARSGGFRVVIVLILILEKR